MISAELLDQVAAAVRRNPDAAALRPQFPGIHFTACAADDINARCQPVQETELYELYLVSGSSGHCLALTGDFAGATGIVVAAKADE